LHVDSHLGIFYLTTPAPSKIIEMAQGYDRMIYEMIKLNIREHSRKLYVIIYLPIALTLHIFIIEICTFLEKLPLILFFLDNNPKIQYDTG
jgi:hypothetical protein